MNTSRFAFRTHLTAIILGIAALSPSVQARTPGASEVVEIRQDQKLTPAPKPAPVKGKHIAPRDPFVNQTSANLPPANTLTTPGKVPPKVQPRQTERPADTAKTPDPLPPPEVTVQGIILSASGNHGILSSPTRTYIVKAGDKLGDYRVEAVQAKNVVFRYKDKSFLIKLQDQFGAVAAAGHKKK